MKTEEISYQDDSTTLKAYVAYDDSTTKSRPGVLVAHAWGGRDDFSKTQAEKLASLGYVGFALDMYGDAKLGTTNEECTSLMTPFMEDRNLLKRRVNLALSTMKEFEAVDPAKTAAIGFCFGGLCVLDLARSGADTLGVTSFHGLLQPNGLEKAVIKAKILALHGYDDPMATPDAVLEFAKEMGRTDWQLHMYGATKHAFTNPQANDEEFGTVFSQKANDRAFQSMQNFLTELFT